MPKQRPTVEEWIRGHEKLIFEKNKVFCKACMKTVNFKILICNSLLNINIFIDSV